MQAQQRVSFSRGQIRIHIQEELVTSTSEFIQNIRREAFKQLKDLGEETAVIKARDQHDLILRTAGLREYFEGNYQLLQYERVRLALRKKTEMQLELTEIPRDYRSKFPPLYKHLNRGGNHIHFGPSAHN